jgi:flagellar biosynthetic protein FliR
MSLWGFELWAVVLAFARAGALVMLLPAFGEASVPAPVRLAFALLLAIMIAPSGVEPPPTLFESMGVLIGEIIVGLTLGAGVRFLMSAVSSAGEILGLETGLSFAQSADPTQNGSGQTISAFLSLMSVALVVATDLHHQMLIGLRDSYQVFAIGGALDIAAFAEYGLNAFITAFRVALQIAAPVIVAGMVFRAGLGVLARLAPTIQVFFVSQPLTILGGFLILMLGLSAGMLVWLDALQDYPLNLDPG